MTKPESPTASSGPIPSSLSGEQIISRVLVTGSEGYVGSVLTPFLRAAGHDVVGLDACWFADARLIPLDGSWPLIRKDLRDVTRDDLIGFDAVIHLAAICNDPLGELDPGLTDAINYHASVRLAELARDAGVPRFLFSSSCSLYGVGQGDQALTEDADFSPQTAYARSKVAAERDLKTLNRPGFCTVALRHATAFGISPRQRFDLVLPNLAGLARTTGVIQMISDGTPWRPLVHIRDMALAFQCALEAPEDRVREQAYNIGSDGENHQVRDIAAAVAAAFPESRLSLGTAKPADTRSYRVSFAKSRDQLPGFSPQWTMIQGVAECVQAFDTIGLTPAMFADQAYHRLRQVRFLLDQGRLNKELRWQA